MSKIRNMFGNNNAFNTAIKESGMEDFSDISTLDMIEAQTELVRESVAMPIRIFELNETLNTEEIRESATQEEYLGKIREAIFGENGWLAKIWRMIKALWTKAVKAVKSFFSKMFGKSSNLRKKFAILEANIRLIAANNLEGVGESDTLAVKRSPESYGAIITILGSLSNPDNYAKHAEDVLKPIAESEGEAIGKAMLTSETATKLTDGLSKFKSTVSSLEDKKAEVKLMKEVYKYGLSKSGSKAFKEDDFNLEKFTGAPAFASTLLERNEILKEELKGKSAIQRWFNGVNVTPNVDVLNDLFKIDKAGTKLDTVEKTVAAISDSVSALKPQEAVEAKPASATSDGESTDAVAAQSEVSEDAIKKVKEVSQEISKMSGIVLGAAQKGALLGNKLATFVINELVKATDSLVKLSNKK